MRIWSKLVATSWASLAILSRVILAQGTVTLHLLCVSYDVCLSDCLVTLCFQSDGPVSALAQQVPAVQLCYPGLVIVDIRQVHQLVS